MIQSYSYTQFFFFFSPVSSFSLIFLYKSVKIFSLVCNIFFLIVSLFSSIVNNFIGHFPSFKKKYKDIYLFFSCLTIMYLFHFFFCYKLKNQTKVLSHCTNIYIYTDVKIIPKKFKVEKSNSLRIHW